MATQPCPKCGNAVRVGAKFCAKCGTIMSAAPPPPPPPATSTTVCPNCGKPVKPMARFCSFCRAALTPLPQSPLAVAPPPVIPLPSAPPAPPRRAPVWIIHALIVALLSLILCLSLTSVYTWEVRNPTATRTTTPSPTPTVIPSPTPTPTPLPPPTVFVPTEPPTPTPEFGGKPVVAIGTLVGTGRFGLRTTTGDPRRTDDDNKSLTFDPKGGTNNTRIWVDGSMPIFGSAEGVTIKGFREEDGFTVYDWEYRKVRVTQKLSIVLGTATNTYDTLRIEYILENTDISPHQAGARIMIDTLIGNNDGVPFSVPTISGITDRATDLTGSKIPDFIQVLENANLTKPGVIVNLTLRGGEATPPERVLITGWYGGNMPWDFLADAGGVGASLRQDSAIGLFYPTQELRPGEKRSIVAFYGLGKVSTSDPKNPDLGLSISSPRVQVGTSFWVIARISNPKSGQRVQLHLPPELQVVEGDITQNVEPAAGANFTTRSWLVKAVAPSAGAEITMALEPGGITAKEKVVIIAPTLAPPTPTLTPTVTPTAIPCGVTRPCPTATP